MVETLNEPACPGARASLPTIRSQSERTWTECPDSPGDPRRDAPAENLRRLAQEVHVWTAPLDLPPALLKDCKKILNNQESDRSFRFRFDLDRNRFIAAHGLTRMILAHYLDAFEFTTGPFGKPMLSGAFARSGLHFNLAHADGLMLLAISRAGPLGIDLERVRLLPEAAELVRRFFCPRESALFQRLPASDQPEAFFNLWTRKEAWLKATGDGIAHLLNRVQVSFEPRAAARLIRLPENHGSPSDWQLHALHTAPGFAAALAIKASGVSIRSFDWNEEVQRRIRFTLPQRPDFGFLDHHSFSNGGRISDRRSCTHERGPAHACMCCGFGFRAHGPSPIALLGIPIDNLTLSEAVHQVEAMIASGQPHYVTTANVDFLVQAKTDLELRRVLCEAPLVLCDGTPLVWLSRILGNPLRERVAGSDLVPLLIETAAQKGYRIFLLGATPDSAAQAVEILRARYPRLAIAGHYSPPFNSLLKMDHEEIIARIKEAQPDIVFVSFGCPKQEKWIAMHYRRLGIPVLIGVGGTIDFLAGRLKRAPLWMHRAGLEWLFRLAQEPKRLFRRYVNDFRVFGREALAQLWSLARRRGQRREDSGRHASSPANDLSSLAVGLQVLGLPRCLNVAGAAQMKGLIEEFATRGGDCAADMSAVEIIDSTGVGLLIRLRQVLTAAGGHLILVAPRENIQRILAQMRLDTIFTFAANLPLANQILANKLRAEGNAVSGGNNGPHLAWHGEITATNAPIVLDQTRQRILNGRGALECDLADVPFLDSSGIQTMIRLKQFARDRAHDLVFTHAQPIVRSLLRLAGLENHLLSSDP